MDAALVRLVWQRASGCCEYCHMPQAGDDVTFDIDHIATRPERESIAGLAARVP
jgi:hypothetical protein